MALHHGVDELFDNRDVGVQLLDLIVPGSL
jgi:hypothetical protein